MSRYTDIELTSQADDGSWTWRAAGARQPRGTLPADLVPSGGRVGDVVRAELESGLDGVEVISISAPKTARRADEGIRRIEVLGAPRPDPGVVISLARGSRVRDRDGRTPDRDRPRREGREGAARPRRDDRRDERRDERTDANGRGPRGGAEARGRREDERRGAPRRPPDRDSEGRGPRTDRPAPRRDHRPTVSATHRNAALATLRPEQLAVAEQLLRGGIPAVRQAIQEQNASAKAAGHPSVSSDALLAMAEELLPLVNLASWKDRATAAQAAGRSMRLRELRAVVAASRTVSLDDEARVLARALQESLTERVNHVREEWEKRIDGALEVGKVLDALQASARPPEVQTRCPAQLAVRLAHAASEAMTAQLPVEEWLALLSAVIDSPVRRTVKPAGIPDAPEAREGARKAAGLVPELAKLIGLPIPPPPPRRGGTAGGRPLSRVSGGGPTAGP